MRSVQKTGPYFLSGYSFGAGVAFEMALLLEAEREKVTLLLLDGSPSYVATYTGNFQARQRPDEQTEDANALTYFISLFKDDIDYVKVNILLNLKCFQICCLCLVCENPFKLHNMV